MNTRFRTYSDAVRYLDSFVSYEKIIPPKYCEKTYYQLDRFLDLLRILQHPEKDLHCIHIAGTDGKGSTSSFIAHLLKAAGKKVGLYTSPHLFDYVERIRVNGKFIPKKAFARLIGKLADILESKKTQIQKGPPLFSTVFELLTAAAFLYFKEQKVDFAVIETGLGGRLDATNVIHPLLSVITPVDREHTYLLGKTLEKIAFEKAGIIKKGCPVFIARQKPSVKQVIRKICLKQQSPLYSLTDFLTLRSVKSSLQGYTFQIKTREGKIETLKCPLLGRHQLANFALALLVTQYLLDGTFAYPIPPGKSLIQLVKTSLSDFKWPGRSELFFLPGGNWILDSAYSPQAAQMLRQLLDELFPGQPVQFLVAFSMDKNISLFSRKLFRPVDKFFCYQSSHPRSMTAENVYKKLIDAGVQNAFPGKDIDKLIKKQGRNTFCVCGSLFWVADVLKKIGK